MWQVRFPLWLLERESSMQEGDSQSEKQTNLVETQNLMLGLDGTAHLPGYHPAKSHSAWTPEASQEDSAFTLAAQTENLDSYCCCGWVLCLADPITMQT